MAGSIKRGKYVWLASFMCSTFTFNQHIKMRYIINFIFGNCKIDKNCTCTVKLIERENGTFVSGIYRNHHGHKSEFRHIWLTTSTRQQIAAKLQQGISKEKILDDIRESVGLEFQREHLFGKRDLFNIEKAFGLANIQRHPNDQDSVLSWIQEWEGSDDNPIVFYKLQGQLKEEVALEKDDFVVICKLNFRSILCRNLVVRVCVVTPLMELQVMILNQTLYLYWMNLKKEYL